MKSSIRWVLVGGVIVGVAAHPNAAMGQEPPPGLPEQSVTGDQPDLSGLALSCTAAAEAGDGFLEQVAQARELESPEAAKAALATLEPEARRTAAESPDDAAAQYRLAAVLGAQLDHEHGRSKMSGAAQVREQAQRVLALDPTHAGASYMLGRLHASVLRMSGFKRFLAKSLFGGSALEGASWEQAQALLEVAVREDPCVPEHHFELARVYVHHGDAAGAERELAYVRELTTGQDGRLARLRERADELEKEWRESGL